jgi:hypothetical protein
VPACDRGCRRRAGDFAPVDFDDFDTLMEEADGLLG